MIRLTCTSCKNVLNIDDAFAGGVCRCQHCGTIQTVPSRQKATALKAAVGGKSSKTLYSNKARLGGAMGSGLEDLADIVASSGLSDKRLRKKGEQQPDAAPGKKLPLLLAAAAGIIAALLIVVVLLIIHSESGKPAPANLENPPNGSSSTKDLDFIKGAVYKSIDSLGATKQFQILFWNPDSDSFPTGAQTAHAAKDTLNAARKKLDDVDASLGATEPTAALQRAFAANPGEVVLITTKAGALDDNLPAAVLAIRGTSTAKIDCFAINGAGIDPVLTQIAAKTGGTYANISEAQLRAASY
jgi:hypothetical protein